MNDSFSASTRYYEVGTVHLALPILKCTLSGLNCSLQQTVQTPLTRFDSISVTASLLCIHCSGQQHHYCPFGKLLNHLACKDIFIVNLLRNHSPCSVTGIIHPVL